MCLLAIDISGELTEIEGPEGSVYEKGVFKLKIQIPERYFSLSTFQDSLR